MLGDPGQSSPGNAFGQHLRSLRRHAGLTQEQLAERSGCSPHTISNIERGAFAGPRADTAALLADGLGLEGDDRSRFFALIEGQRSGRAEPLPGAPSQGSPGVPLPEPAGSLLGRGEELAALRSLLHDPASRIVTLLGPGGVGKTRLALEAARATAARGLPAAWAALEALGSAEEVLPAIARAVGAAGDPQADDVARIADAVGDRRLLLVVDNCEHVIDAARDLAAVLAAAPRLQVLATSREALRIGGEVRVAVPPLPVPAAGDDAARAAASPSVALFVERAGLEGGGGAALADVRQVVTALDGVPLAIELAAAQAGSLSVGAVAGLLQRSGIEVLETGRRDVHPRLRSMDVAIRWSCDLLEERDRRLLRAMSVFRGGADLDLLADVCERLGEPGLLRSLPALVRASLASDRPGADGRARISLLSPIRLFAEGELAASGETPAAELAHRGTMREFARRAFARMSGPDPLPALEEMDRERDNLVAALERSIRAGDAHDALALAACMGLWWETRGEVVEGVRWLQRVLAMDAGDAHPEDVSQAGRVAAMFAAFLGRTDWWRAVAERMLAVATAADDRPGIAIALGWLGDHAWYVDGDEARARDCHERAVGLLDPLGDRIELAQACDRLGDFLLEHGDPAGGLALTERAVAIRRRIGNEIVLANSLTLRATALSRLGRDGEARAGFLEAGELAGRLGHPSPMIFALVNVAGIDAAGADPARQEVAPLLLGAAEAALSRRRMVLDAALVPIRERTMADLAAALGEAERDRLLDEGRSLTEAEALALAGA